MNDFFGGLLRGVALFYAWTVGSGLALLALIALLEGAVDLVRDILPRPSSRSLSRPRA